MPPDQQSWLYWIAVAFGGLSAVAVLAAVTYWTIGEVAARRRGETSIARSMGQTAEFEVDSKHDRR